MKIKLILMGLSFVLIGFSQTNDSILIKGEVISKDKNPISGLLIQINNTERETLSDVCGQFELWSPIEGVLKFSWMTEPYYISLNSIGLDDIKDFLTFRFDLDKENSVCDKFNKNGKTIKIDKDNQSIFSRMILANYDRDLESITEKHYERYKKQDKSIIFVANDNILDENYTPADINYDMVDQITIMRTLDSYDRIIFVISIDKKNRK